MQCGYAHASSKVPRQHLAGAYGLPSSVAHRLQVTISLKPRWTIHWQLQGAPGLAGPSAVGIGNVLLFQTESGKMNSLAACRHMRPFVGGVSLPYASFHQLHHNFAKRVQTLFVSAVACKLPHHNLQQDALNCNATGGINLSNLIKICTRKSDRMLWCRTPTTTWHIVVLLWTLIATKKRGVCSTVLG